jgi:hypothetical protein
MSVSITDQFLTELSSASPEEIEKIAADIKNLPEEQQIALQVLLRSQLMTLDADGYGNFYYCLYQREVPKHAEEWVAAIFRAYEDESGALIEGFRGSTKSTIAHSIVLYLNSLMPERSSLIVCATDVDAKSMAQQMADTVEYNAGYKTCFPNVVPDKDRGWGAEGYHLKDTNIGYDEWVQAVMKDHGRDPSFLAVSITSGSVGKHPSLCLFMDDIHNRKNTVSEAERKRVVDTLKSDVLPTMSKPKPRPFMVVTFTPWDEEDAYSELKRSGEFEWIQTPVYTVVEESDIEFDGQKIELTWPDVFTIEEINKWRKRLGKTEFARMYELDLTRAGVTLFVYYTYPHEVIDLRWPTAGGVDFASIRMPTRQKEGGRSHFAMAYIAKTPMNKIVVFDGILEQCTTAQSEQYVLSAQDRYPAWKTTVIESDGKGEEFINILRRNPNSRIYPHGTGGHGKADRLYTQMSPWLENMNVLISTAETPYLNALRRFFERYPNLDKTAKEWDAADALYHSLFAFQECLIMPVKADDLPAYEVKKKKVNPFSSLGDR